MKTIFVILFIGFFAGLNAKENSKIETFLLQQIAEFHIPALSVAIIQNGEVKLIKTYEKRILNMIYQIQTPLHFNLLR